MREATSVIASVLDRIRRSVKKQISFSEKRQQPLHQQFHGGVSCRFLIKLDGPFVIGIQLELDTSLESEKGSGDHAMVAS